MSRRASLLAVVALGAGALAGCGGGDSGDPPTGTDGAGAATTAAPAAPGEAAPEEDPRATAGADPGATTPVDPGGTTPANDAVAAPPRGWTATCPTRTPSPLGCRGVRGRVLAIQSYDPDGDGDLHVIAVGGDVTTPGVTVFDVRPSLRPDRDPVKGEYVTGAGPVFRGSLGQRQIQVDVFRVWRPAD